MVYSTLFLILYSPHLIWTAERERVVMVGLLWVEVGTNLIHIHRYLQCIKVMMMMMN